MTVLHVFPIKWEGISGLTAAIPPLIRAQNSLEGVASGLLATLRSSVPTRDPGFPVFAYDVDRRWPGVSGLSPPFNEPDVAVFHSTYLLAYPRVARQLRTASIPYIIVPHGGMGSASQPTKWLKKRIGNLMFFNQLVRNAVAIQCLTEGELQATAGWKQPMFVVGNGVDAVPDEFVAKPGALETLRLIFLGRIIPHRKGLETLLQACALVRSDLLGSRAQLLLYGPDREGGIKAVERLVSELKLSDIVRLCGPVLGEAKRAVLSQSDAFVLTPPPGYEGHPMALLEALSHGVPSLVTPGTNISSEVAGAGAGWEVDYSPEGIAQGLIEILSNKDELRVAGRRARALAIDEYSWEQVAKNSVAAYGRCLGRAREGE